MVGGSEVAYRMGMSARLGLWVWIWDGDGRGDLLYQQHSQTPSDGKWSGLLTAAAAAATAARLPS